MWKYNYYPNSDELYHHGIMGMKWGKRNGPPYPLGVSDHSSSEKKAGWRKSLDSDGRVAAARAKKKEAKAYKKAANKQYTKDFNKYYNRSTQAYSPSKKQRKANSERFQKALASGAKAHEADIAYKIAKKEYKNINREAKLNADMNKTLDARAKNRTKLENRYDKKISRAQEKGNKERVEELKNKKDYKIKDFDDGTKYVKAGYEKYNSIDMKYKNMKVSALSDPSIKKTAAYKKAGREYAMQVLSDNYYGTKEFTIFNYASDEARNDRASR